jgi:hypothetical protein
MQPTTLLVAPEGHCKSALQMLPQAVSKLFRRNMSQENIRHQQRSWLSLVTFCAVTVLIAALGSAVLFAGASVAFATGEFQNATATHEVSFQTSDGSAPADQTFNGVITDSRCGARHRKNSGKAPAECTRTCVKGGAKYVLVDGEKIYALQGDPAPLERLAGQRVTVVGDLEGTTIKVKTVSGV